MNFLSVSDPYKPRVRPRPSGNTPAHVHRTCMTDWNIGLEHALSWLLCAGNRPHHKCWLNVRTRSCASKPSSATHSTELNVYIPRRSLQCTLPRRFTLFKWDPWLNKRVEISVNTDCDRTHLEDLFRFNLGAAAFFGNYLTSVDKAIPDCFRRPLKPAICSDWF